MKTILQKNLFMLFACLLLLTGFSLARPVAADAGGTYVVAKKIEGKFVLQKRAKLRDAIQAKVGSKHTVKLPILDQYGDKYRIIFVIDENGSGNKGVLGFPLLELGNVLKSDIPPGQTCKGDPCEACQFRNSGWGCSCVDEGGSCNHTATSFSLEDAIGDYLGNDF